MKHVMSKGVVPVARCGMLAGACALVGCTAPTSSAPSANTAGASARLDFSPQAGFFDAPFPVLHRARANGTLRVADLPNFTQNPLVQSVLDALEQHGTGFGTNAAIFLPWNGPLDPSTLPGVQASLLPNASVFLVDVTPSSPTQNQRVPVRVVFKQAYESYTPPNVLVVLPEPGFVLRPHTFYAAVVTDAVQTADGLVPAAPDALVALAAGSTPLGPDGTRIKEAFDLLWAHLDGQSVPRTRVVAATVFETGQPLKDLLALRDHVRQLAQPTVADLHQIRDHGAYCVVEGTVSVPLFQQGTRPFASLGGAIVVNAQGNPEVELQETIRFAVSIPRQAMPAQGWPLLLYSAGQGGAYTQVMDRNTAADQGTMGMGPARYLASVGLAALSVEAPLVGPRHPTGSTTGLDFFNVFNPLAFRDNSRHAALDLVTLVRLVRGLELPADTCTGATAAAGFRFDADNIFFWGHSTGATVGAMVLGMEGGIAAGMLSGAGGSWLYNLTLKQEPYVFKELVQLLSGLRSHRRGGHS